MFGNRKAVDNVTIEVPQGAFLSIFGPNGAGKTTLTKLLLRLSDIQEGRILIDGQNIAETTQQSLRRQIAYVPQEALLFHRTIAENIAFGLKIKNKPKSYIDDKIKYALKLVNLDGFENRSVASLSGGQQQRIAIARAICKRAPGAAFRRAFRRPGSKAAPGYAVRADTT